MQNPVGEFSLRLHSKYDAERSSEEKLRLLWERALPDHIESIHMFAKIMADSLLIEECNYIIAAIYMGIFVETHYKQDLDYTRITA